jgi:DNA repair exonuclease SbcCD ATPase subunit
MKITKKEQASVLRQRAAKLEEKAAAEELARSIAGVAEYHLCPVCGQDIGFEESRHCRICGYRETDPQYD